MIRKWIFFLKHILSYRYKYTRIAWLTRDNPFVKKSSGVIVYGQTGWFLCFMAFSFFAPKKWYGYPANSWKEARQWKHKKSPYYGHAKYGKRIQWYKALRSMWQNRTRIFVRK